MTTASRMEHQYQHPHQQQQHLQESAMPPPSASLAPSATAHDAAPGEHAHRDHEDAEMHQAPEYHSSSQASRRDSADHGYRGASPTPSPHGPARYKMHSSANGLSPNSTTSPSSSSSTPSSVPGPSSSSSGLAPPGTPNDSHNNGIHHILNHSNTTPNNSSNSSHHQQQQQHHHHHHHEAPREATSSSSSSLLHSDQAQHHQMQQQPQQTPNTNHHSGHHYQPPQQPQTSSHHHQQQHHLQQTPTSSHSNNHHHSTPSPPIPSPGEGFQGRPLPPIEPSHPLHTYMSNSRRGSITDPEFHVTGSSSSSSSSADPHHRRPSTVASAMDSGYYSQEHRYYPSIAGGPPGSESFRPHPSTSPMQLRQQEHAAGRRESLPSIHSSAGPLGQLFAQEPQRRHSIAHGATDPNGSPSSGQLKRKTSGTKLSHVHSSSTMDYPSKRRDSIPDAVPMHQLSQQHAYRDPRSSYSAPSSPPRRASVAHNHYVPMNAHGPPSTPGGTVPTLNLQPAAEIKSSPSSSSSSSMMMSSGGVPGSSGAPGSNPMSPQVVSPGMEHGRPHYPHHPSRRPSMLSESGMLSLSRRSSTAELHHPSAYQRDGPGNREGNGQYPGSDYDHHMGIDLEKMHLSAGHHGNGNGVNVEGGVTANGSNMNGVSTSSSSTVQGGPATGGAAPGAPGTQGGAPGSGNHLYPPGYHSGYPSDGGSHKGDTPYSRSPELRVSHKLAERKRRKEMKELFDELRDSLPVDRSLKTSKWEILSKAVEYISNIKGDHDALAQENEHLRQQLARMSLQQR